MLRTVGNFDLSPCYRVTATAGNGLVVRCRFCSAGWLPTGSCDASALIRHARKQHRRRLWPKILRPAALHTGMIHIPEDAKVVRDIRLDVVKLISVLHDRFCDSKSKENLKNKVKATMAAKGAAFAEGDYVVAALRGGGFTKSSVDPAKLWELVEAGKLTKEQFFFVVSVTKKPLEEFLSGNEIESISTEAGGSSTPALYIDFRDEVKLDFDQLADSLYRTLVKTNPA